MGQSLKSALRVKLVSILTTSIHVFGNFPRVFQRLQRPIVLKAKNYIQFACEVLAIATAKIQTQDSYQTTCDFFLRNVDYSQFLDN